ncbi:MAG TPA: cytochrome P450 [Acidimicrobiales bacterium]|nr:cytochrome P450 [Acidimicrobiales bacterium]
MAADELIDIYAFWAQCRAECPVTVIDGPGRQLWFVTRFEDVQSILHDARRFSSSINAETMGPVMGAVILAMDGDEHRRYRDVVGRAFRPSALARWEDELIAPTIHRLLDDIAPLGHADLVDAVTSRYPVQVIAGVLGVPVEDHALFHRWAIEISHGPEDYGISIPASEAMRRYLEPLVEQRRARPGDDLVSDIVHAEVDGRRLGDDHVYGFLRLLLPAGAETTYRVMGNCLVALLAHPEVLDQARADPALLDSVIEETLRWETSVTMINRVTTEDVELGGVVIPAGASVVCALGSANHDEARFSDPDRWDPTRQGPGHISFGTGRHQCLGMHLARLELRVGLAAVLARLPGLRRDPDAAAMVIDGLAFRGPQAMPVLFEAA